VEALDACTRLPMIVKPPASVEVADHACGSLATHTDIPATVLDLLGVEPEIEMHGRSLLPAIRGEDDAPRDHVVSSGMYLLDEDDVWKSIEVSARTERWRLRRRAPLGSDYPMHGLKLSGLWEIIARLYEDEPEYELYRSSFDPDELTDVCDRHPDVVAKLDALLEPAVGSPYWYEGKSNG
jgi:arylsulfatase A-like enzyme